MVLTKIHGIDLDSWTLESHTYERAACCPNVKFSLNRPDWADSVIELPCPSVCVCLSVCENSKHRLPEDVKSLVKGRIANFGMQ